MIKNFKIEHLDSLGQGVSKANDEIIFVQRSLPGEEGTCEITGSKSRVSFGVAKSVSLKSEKRIEAQCLHYDQCGGCDYLHVSYKDEVEFKTQALKDIFLRAHRFSKIPEIVVLKADKRFNYRNRLQLHYDKKLGLLGLKGITNHIVSIENCLLPSLKVSEELKKLYKSQKWKELLKKERTRGHIELYERDNKVELSINKNYAAGGFSQVNSEMNDKLHFILDEYFVNNTSNEILDLFGGAGNITKNAKASKIIVVDSTDKKFIKLKNKNQSYYKINIYSKNALQEIKKLKISKGECLVLDPPRSGLKNIDDFTQELDPSSILYVSCNPQTLARDIKSIESNYELQNIYLIDFFPGTKHFETVAIMKRK